MKILLKNRNEKIYGNVKRRLERKNILDRKLLTLRNAFKQAKRMKTIDTIKKKKLN